ncbi:MAG: ScpA family protein [Ornithinimicrobium sp.]
MSTVAGVAAEERTVPGGVLTRRAAPFEVHLEVFSGPFELLLGLIAKHKLDVTEIALSKVTDEFVASLRAAQLVDEESGSAAASWDLSQASEFVVVAATLLDLKASRLLPRTGDEPEEDLELIEARDLLFARLLQYRAFKQVAAEFEQRMAGQGRIWAREAGVEPQFAALLPELVMNVSGHQLAQAAARALTPTPQPSVGLAHLHTPAVSVSEQARVVLQRMEGLGTATFAEMIADAESRSMVVARFLALLELFRDGALAFEQEEAMAPLLLRWVAPTARGDGGAAHERGSEFDVPDLAVSETGAPDIGASEIGALDKERSERNGG